MAQILLKKQASKAEEKEEEFVIISPAQIQIPKPEGLTSQARDREKKEKNKKSFKKSLLKLFKNGKSNPKYLEEVIRMNRYKVNLDNQALFVRKVLF